MSIARASRSGLLRKEKDHRLGAFEGMGVEVLWDALDHAEKRNAMLPVAFRIITDQMTRRGRQGSARAKAHTLQQFSSWSVLRPAVLQAEPLADAGSEKETQAAILREPSESKELSRPVVAAEIANGNSTPREFAKHPGATKGKTPSMIAVGIDLARNVFAVPVMITARPRWSGSQ